MFRPLGTRLLVRRTEQVTETPGGIIIPEAYVDRTTEGEVMAIGDEVTKVKIGEHVLFAKYAGSTIENQDGEGDLLIVDETHILGVME